MAALGLLAFLAWGAGAACAQMLESFEYGVPPPGWIKTNLQGGSGWYQLPVGVAPLPGWGNGTSSVPVTVGAGTHNAYCSWDTGGSAAQGYHNDQWLISPRMTGLTATSTVSYWLRFNFTNYPDEVRFRVSTNGPAPANFTFVPLTNIFAKASYTNQFPPWSNHVVNVGALGIPAGTPIWIAIQEYVWDNTWNGAAVQLDVIASDLTVPPQPRTSPTSLVFTAYYEGVNPAAQTFSVQSIGSSGMSFSSQPVFGAGPTNWLTVGGPSTGTLPLQQSQTFTASVSVVGLDLGTYVATNVFNVPGATNSPLRVPITLNVIRRPQTIMFPNPGPQYTTNQVGLAGTASSGLPVIFSVFSGPGNIVGATNLSFTGTGTVKVVAWQLGNVYYDVAPCITNSIAVTKPNATILFTNLSQVYDGLPHGATITTVPEGLTVDTTYNGGPSLPVAIGSYAVTSIVNDVLYGGQATATFTITRMVQTVDFPDPGPQWTTNKVGLAATASSGLPVTFSVAAGPGTIHGGTNLAFTGAGTVDVVAIQAGDADWLPTAATNSIVVSKVAATVTLGDLNPTYDGTAKSATATTEPPGLTVDFTYDGSGTAPANAGSYAVTGTVNDAIYQGLDIGMLVIGKGTASVALDDLEQDYDGTPRPVTATTVPAGLAVEFTYDGATNAPIARGGYAVTGTVHDVNWQGAATGTLLIDMGAATVTLENLSQEYDGTPKHATATTVPAGLVVDITCDGTTNWPVAVGSYAVTGTVNDLDWAGSSTGTLTIGKGAAQVTLLDLSQIYDGTAKHATATTAPAGLVVEITYDGATNWPVAVGSYAVTGTVLDANYQGAATGTLTIGKAVAAVTLDDLTHVYDGMAKHATALTDPAGLTVEFTYDGVASAPVAAGSYVVTGMVNDVDWQGVATSLFVIGKADATVALDSLEQTYDGTAKKATATTDPAGLMVEFTYDGFAFAPTNAGRYAVTGTVNDVNWQGASTGTLTIVKAEAEVTLGSLSQTYDGTAKTATAITDPAGLMVEFTYDGSTTVPTGVGSYVVTGMINEANWWGSSTGTLTIGPGAATVTLESLTQTYDGTPKSATATTVPAGLAVHFTYDGSAIAPSHVGSYAVTGTVNEANWQGEATGTLTIGKGSAMVTLGHLRQAFDGTPKRVIATTEPPGLAVDFTYDGAMPPPTDVGTYAVTGTVADANWEGAAASELQIVPAPASLGDTIWLDANWDGVQNAGESGIPNVRIELATNGTVISEAVTDFDGRYVFTDLLAGEYTVRVDTSTLAGPLVENPTYDPDDPALPRDHQTTVMLAPGESAAKADFGYNWSAPDSLRGAIGDRIWVDANRNGWQDPGEPGIPGATVELTIDAAGNGNYTAQVATATTDTAGQYIFSGLAAGAYGIRVDTATLPPGFIQTGDPDFFGSVLPPDQRDHRTTAAVVLAPGGVFVNADFGYAFPQGSAIGGRMVLDLNANGTPEPDEPGISGVTVALLDSASNAVAGVTTGANGAYRFTGLPAGICTVRVGDAENQLDRRVQTGDPDGVLDRQSTVVVDGVSEYQDRDYGFAPDGHGPGYGLIGDTIFLDRDGDGGDPLPGEGLEGVTVDLFDYTGLIRLATTSTDADGLYYFGGLEEETYHVVVDTNTLPNGGFGLVNTADPDTLNPGDSRATVAVAAGMICLGQNFGYVAAEPNTIRGILWRDDNANGLIDADEEFRFEGVRVVLHLSTGQIVGSMFTGADGVYRFTGLPDGIYGIEVFDLDHVIYGFWSSPAPAPGPEKSRRRPISTGVAVSGGETYALGNLGHYLPSAALGDYVWRDTNGNGLQDGSESGLTGVQVSLRIEYPNGSDIHLQTRTFAQGLYRFSNLLLDPRYIESTTNEPAMANLPRYTVSMDINQPLLLGVGFTPTLIDAGSGINDSRDPVGVFAFLQMGGDRRDFDFGYRGGPLLAVIGNVEAFTREGEAIVRWETVESWNTAGFWLERQIGDQWARIGQKMLEHPLFGEPPIVYEAIDPDAKAGGTYWYRLVELENAGSTVIYGPYQLTMDGPGRTYADWATAYFTTDELADLSISGRAADPDGDGLINGQEFLAWTDPHRADSVLQISTMHKVADGLELSWQSVAGRFYQILWAQSMLGPFWPLLPEQPILATDETTRLTLPIDFMDRQLYFQVILVGGASGQ